MDQHQTIATIAMQTRTIALVGASNKPARASYSVMAFLMAKGYHVIPVNPQLVGEKIHQQTVVARLADCKSKSVDMVDIFRNTEDAAKVIDEAIALKNKLHIKTIWCQLEITPFEAAKRAEAAGLTVIMDKCPAIEWR